MDHDRLLFTVKYALWRHRRFFPRSGAIEDFATYARFVLETLGHGLAITARPPTRPPSTPADGDRGSCIQGPPEARDGGEEPPF
jgi:hypothetical protein